VVEKAILLKNKKILKQIIKVQLKITQTPDLIKIIVQVKKLKIKNNKKNIKLIKFQHNQNKLVRLKDQVEVNMTDHQ
jgi:uncharacterized protein with von Willebrand factor type A (vWA) domain